MVNFDFKDRPNEERIKVTSSEYFELDSEIVMSFLNFQWSYRSMQRQYDALLGKYGLSESRYIILMFLKHADGKRLLSSTIADKLGATRPTVSKLLKGMEKSGYIVKTVSEKDKRSSYFQMTDIGERVLEDFIPASFGAVKTIFNYFEKKDFSSLDVLLKKINCGTQKISKEDVNNAK